MRAWKGIKELPPGDPRSFFVLGGYHGEPFRGAGWGSSAYWGGYCNHGNVLFPTWHRVYVLKVEEALQSIPGCQDVMLPYWDETSPESSTNGIPWPLTDESFELDGKQIPNPLRSFVFPLNIKDNINGDNPNYSKLKGYETVRYPLSGLVGTADDQKATEAHNKKFPDYKTNVQLLNANVIAWLTSVIVVKDEVIPTHVAKLYKDCLDAPNYTVFSNTTSAAEWNTNLPDKSDPVVPLEKPHNSVHLSVGGCEVRATTVPRSTGPTAIWARMTPRVWIRSSSSTIVMSIACSGSGRRNMGSPTISKSSPSIPGPIPWITRVLHPASCLTHGLRWKRR